jgi:hypothetical protein
MHTFATLPNATLLNNGISFVNKGNTQTVAQPYLLHTTENHTPISISLDEQF